MNTKKYLLVITHFKFCELKHIFNTLRIFEDMDKREKFVVIKACLYGQNIKLSK